MYKNLQEAFNVAYAGLKRQGWKKSVKAVHGSGVSCVYRSEIDGQKFKCAVGHLVPDEFVNENNNSRNFLAIIDSNSVGYDGRWKAHFQNINADHLYNLQQCHDRSSFYDSNSDMPDRLEAFARQYNLTIPEVT